jgi:hypothetical protein
VTGIAHHLGIVRRRLDAGPTAVSLQHGGKVEGLGRLDPEDLVSRDGRPVSIDQRIGKRQGRNGAAMIRERIEEAIDDSWRHERACGIVDQDGRGCKARRNRGQAIEDGLLPRRSANDQRANIEPVERGLRQRPVVLADDNADIIDARVPGDRLDRMAKHRLGSERPILLWDTAAEALAGSGGDDQGCNILQNSLVLSSR